MEYPKELHENHNELPFLTETMKIEHGLKLKKVHRVIEFQQSRCDG